MASFNIAHSISHALIFIFLFFPSSLKAQNEKSNDIEVEGFSKTKIRPDLVTYTFSVQKTDPSENRVIEMLNAEIEHLVRVLHQAGIADSLIKVEDYNISKSQNNCQLLMYSGSNSLKLEFSIDSKLLDRIYEQIQQAQLSDLDVTYETSISNNLEKTVRTILVQRAIADAKENAENIARPLNLKIASVRRVYWRTAPTESEDFDRVEVAKFAPPQIEKDQEVRTNTPFAKFQIADVELAERITVIFEISQ